MAVIIQLRRDTSTNWATVNPILADGEVGFESDTKKFKFGNAVDAWNILNYSQGTVVLGETETTSYRGDRGKIAYDHSQTDHAPSNATAAGATGDAHAATAHAPSDAQKNSDITKAEIEAKLTGEVSSHSHAGGGGTSLTLNAEITADTTLTFAHANKYIPVNSATAKSITINPNVFAANDIVAVEQTGAGIVTLIQGTSMTLNGEKKSWGQYSVLHIYFKSATVATVIGGSV